MSESYAGFDELFPGQVSPAKEKVAHAISTVSMPTFVSIPVFIILSLPLEDPVKIAICSFICILFTVILPMAVILTYAKLKGTNMDIPDRKQRTVPAIAGIIFYIMGYFVVTAIDAPHVLTVLMAAYAVCTMFMTVISLYWKISFHAIGMVGPVMSLAMQYGPFLLLLLLCLFPVGWARYVLRKHTLAQLVAGVSLGFVLMVVVFQLMGPAIF